jgi:hypothetical protein
MNKHLHKRCFFQFIALVALLCSSIPSIGHSHYLCDFPSPIRLRGPVYYPLFFFVSGIDGSSIWSPGIAVPVGICVREGDVSLLCKIASVKGRNEGVLCGIIEWPRKVENSPCTNPPSTRLPVCNNGCPTTILRKRSRPRRLSSITTSSKRLR